MFIFKETKRQVIRINTLRFGFPTTILSFLIFFSIFFHKAEASALLLSPTTGTFVVGSTFEVSVLLDTQGKSINALDVDLHFPADKIQLVSPKTSVSVISVWTSQPKFNNETGTIRLQGGIPRGINVNNALVANFTFRVRSVGTAILQFSDQSKVLLNDGLGTNDLSRREDAIYQLILPPPAGPIVVSETHPNQSQWYSNSTAIFSWAPDVPVEGYSYVLNDEPVSLIDDTVDSTKTQVAYQNLSDGRHYFHIKAIKNGSWGGTTHFAVKVDTTPPADYKVEVLPNTRTTTKQPIVKFATTDNLSGIGHYEIKMVPLTPQKSLSGKGDQVFFIESESPYLPTSLDIGSYDIILRAYDNAGNYKEETERFSIVSNVFSFISDHGFVVWDLFVIPWLWFWILCFVLLVILSYLAFVFKRRHAETHSQRLRGELSPDIKNRLEELKKYREKYGAAAVFLLLCGTLLFNAHAVSAVSTGQVELSPPLLTTVSRNISNEDIFYAGGKTDAANTKIVLYVQNLTTGETRSYEITSDNKGDWFYRHDTFLDAGSYLLWTQGKIGEQLSPPSPQIQLTVNKTAFQFGVSRVSYEIFYLLLVIIFAILFLILLLYIIFHARQGRRKQALLMREIKEAEESVRRGFAVLKRDIQAELAIVKKAKMEGTLVAQERSKEEQLLRDLESIERHISKEIWDVEALQRG